MSKIVECHEKDFLAAYNTNMYQIKKELKELKEKTNKEKLKAKNESKIRMLEQERDWFRDEALKLDKSSNEYKQILEKFKSSLEVVEEDRDFFQDQLFNAKKFNKALNLELQKMSTQINDPDHLPLYDSPVKEETIANQMQSNDDDQPYVFEDYKEKMANMMQENALLKKREKIYKDTIQNLQRQDKFRKKPTENIGAQLYDNNELKEFFLSCIEEIKKDIIKRRTLPINYSTKKYAIHQILQKFSNNGQHTIKVR